MDDDWRLMGQERFLQDATFVHKAYRAWSPTWEHDHCSLSTRKLVEKPTGAADELTEAWAAVGRGPAGQDDYHWVCDDCFKDFRERFAWKVAER
jgi:hypothetical protein